MGATRLTVSLRRIAPALIVSVLAIMAVPASSLAASATSVVMLSDPGDYIGGNLHRLYTPADGSVTVGGGASYLTVASVVGPAATTSAWTSPRRRVSR